MDCPSEEQMIRMKLENAEGLVKLDFDIPNRSLSVFHTSENVELIADLLNELNMGSSLLVSEKSAEPAIQAVNLRERKALWWVLAINFAFFIIEMSTGLISRSMGLVADSLDMLADSFVYGLSLMAVGGAISKKKTHCQVKWLFSNHPCIAWFFGGDQKVYWI